MFCEELGWVPPLESGLEVDQYDDKAVSFGVFNRHNTLMAYIRLISSKNTYMIEKDFSILVDPTHSIRKSRDTAETSRVCVASGFRNQTFTINSEIFDISMLLFKGVYLWCLENGIRVKSSSSTIKFSTKWSRISISHPSCSSVKVLPSQKRNKFFQLCSLEISRLVQQNIDLLFWIQDSSQS